jgi:hypothetical protein
VVASVLALVAPVQATYSGTVRLGYVWLDEDGHQGLNQPTFNVYEGVALSLHDFRQSFSDGTYIFGDLRNVTLNNRRLYGGVARPGLFRAALRHHQYRRVYAADGSDFTKRSRYSGDAWFRPHPSVKLFGAYGLTEKQGKFQELYELGSVPARGQVDYRHRHYRGGVRLERGRSTVELEVRGSSFNDELDTLDDRKSIRWRAAAQSPLPRYRRLTLNAGFQHYERWRTGRPDTLTANTAWGGARIRLAQGLSGRYSLIFDRARRTGDLAASDNIVNSVSAQKVWPRQGGLNAGFRYQINDDVFHDVRSTGFFVSGWAQPARPLNLRASLGLTNREDQESSTLTGDEDLTRVRLSATYRHTQGRVRARFESRNREWSDVGSSVDYTRAGFDLRLTEDRYGTLVASYDYMTGDYEDATNAFEFADHVITGELQSVVYRGVSGLVGGTYLRSQKDLDTERFSVRLGGRYALDEHYTFEVLYTAHNFDDLLAAETTPIYTEYYTANIVEVSIQRELGR